MSDVMMVTFTCDNSSVEGIEERVEGDDDTDDRIDTEKGGKEPAERPGGPPE
jgi:hypothetical protein